MQLPWKIRKPIGDIYSFLHYLIKSIAYRRINTNKFSNQPTVEFNIPFYGFTGGGSAILTVANLISHDFSVSLFTHRTNIFNRYVSRRIKLVTKPSLDRDVYIMESGTDATLMGSLLASGRKVIISNHGFITTAVGAPRNYGYDDKKILFALSNASSAHFLSQEQADATMAFCPSIKNARIIPNSVNSVARHRLNHGVGIVCDTTLPLKNVAAAILAAEASSASSVHVWGRFQDKYSSTRAIWHGFEKDKNRIYASFDVLVSLSLTETQPLTILEAMSAGIPCVLNDLSCYEFLKDVPGIWFVETGNIDQAIDAINTALKADAETRAALINYWRDHYSPDVAKSAWINYIRDIVR